jgi:Leucine-rich repeat (LRR) protein
MAFLDLAQNNIRKIDAGLLAGLDSLTALNLERNAIQKLQRDIFDGVNDTLSSLSLLNNLLTEYPIEALNSLKELRVRIISH